MKSKIKSSNINGHPIRFESFGQFFTLFSELFIHEVYACNEIKDAKFIIDCGANIGMSALYFKSKFPNARILCFEPDKNTFDLLKKNVTPLSIEAINKGVGEKKGKVKFYSDGLTGGIGNSTIHNKKTPQRRLSGYVNLTKLSREIMQPVDILKIDIEGGEGQVIKELDKAKKLRMVNNILMEYHYYESGENKLSEIIETLERNGFATIINSNSYFGGFSSEVEKLKKNGRYTFMIFAYKK